MSKLFPFHTDEKTAKAILGVAKEHLSQPRDGQVQGVHSTDVTTQHQHTCQFKLITDWKELSASHFVVSGEKFVPLQTGAEKRSYPTTIYAYGKKPTSAKDSIIVATRRANQWVLLPTGETASGEPATVIEPFRRPLFRHIKPDSAADANTPVGNAAQCMGTIALPNKTYSPIRAVDSNDQPLEDSNGNPLYQKRREPRTGSGRFVLRENGKTSEGFEWIYCDGTTYDGEETTTDIEKAQFNYDKAICYNLDWSECLIEGDKVHYIERDGYYEVKPIDKFTTPVEGQAAIILYEVAPQWNNTEQLGDPDTWTMTPRNDQSPERPEPPNFEAVYLKLKSDRCTPELVKTMGICNDCSSLRVRGCFIREDIKGRRYPMLFELATLRAGGAIRSREVSCYYATEHDKCSPITNQPEMQLIRLNDWRLSLSPSVCTTTCTELVDPISTQLNATP